MSEHNMAAVPEVLTVADLWALQTYDFTVAKGPGGRPLIFKLRRMDLLTQLMEDVVNAPMLKAAMKILEEVQAWLQEHQGESFESAFQYLSPENRQTVLEQLCHFASKVVMTPKLWPGPKDKHDPTDVCPPDHFPALMLGAETLFAIWNHTPPAPAVPRLSEVAAETFHPGAGHDAPRAVPDGEHVRPAAVDVGAAGGRATDA